MQSMLRRSFSKNGATSWCVCVTYEQEVHQPPPEQTEEAPAHQLQKLYSGDIRFVLQCPGQLVQRSSCHPRYLHVRIARLSVAAFAALVGHPCRAWLGDQHSWQRLVDIGRGV